MRASQSMSTSHHCQNGLAHLPPTNPKSMALTPSPTMRFAKRCPKIRTSRMTPDIRMYTQPHFSRLMPWRSGGGGGGCGSGGSVDSRHVQALLAEDVDEVTGKEAEHGNNPQPDDDIKQGALVSGCPEPKVNEDDPDAVKGVKDDRGHKRCLAKTHDRGLVRADDGVIRLWAYPNQRCVEHMNEEEEEDCDAGNAVQNP